MANARDLFLNLIERKRGNALMDAARDLDRLAAQTDETSGRFRAMSRDADGLTRSIEESRAKVRALYGDFAQNRDSSIFGDIRREEQNLRRLERTVKALRDDKGDRARGLMRLVPGNWFGGGVGGFDFSSFAAEARAALIMGLIGAAITVSPLLGGIIGGAVTAAIGMGGIAGGIIAAAHDPYVHAAAREFGDIMGEAWGRAGEVFVGPTVKALSIIKDALVDIDIGSVFEPAARYVEPFARGLAALARNFMPGFNAALENAGPFIEVLRQELGELGSALGDMLKDFMQSPGALDGLRSLFDVLDATLTALGYTVEWLGDQYHAFLIRLAQFSGGMEDVVGWVGLGGEAWAQINDHVEAFLQSNQDAVRASGNFAASVDGTTRAMWRQNAALADAIDKYRDMFDIQMSLDQAILRNMQGWIDLARAFKENGRVWDMSEAGIANQDAVLRKLQDIQAEYESMLRQQGADPAMATAWLDAQIQKLYEMAEAAGATKAELDKINGYRLQINVAAALSGYIPSGFWPTGTTGNTTPAAGGYHGYAAGGDVPPGPHWVGEMGKELRFAPGYVMPHGASMAYMAGRAAGGAAGPAEVVLRVAPGAGGAFEAFLIDMIDRFVYATGGGDARVAFASRR